MTLTETFPLSYKTENWNSVRWPYRRVGAKDGGNVSVLRNGSGGCWGVEFISDFFFGVSTSHQMTSSVTVSRDFVCEGPGAAQQQSLE